MELETEPPWLTAKADQRIASMVEATGEPAFILMGAMFDIVMTFLTEADDESSEAMARWELTCDCCGKQAEEKHSGMVPRTHLGVKVQMTFAVCPTCFTRSTS